MIATAAAHSVIEHAIAAGVFPAAAIEVGDSAGPLWQDALGTMAFDVDARACIDTPFDLASLTKALATTTVAMELVNTGRVRVDERVSALFDEWRGADREHVTVGDLLEHASGLPARLVDQPPPTRREFEHDIAAIRLEYAPRTRSVYSDLGFILLSMLVEKRAGEPLDVQFDTMWKSVVAGNVPTDVLGFHVLPSDRVRTAPTTPLDDDARVGRVLTGEVHDAYAEAL